MTKLILPAYFYPDLNAGMNSQWRQVKAMKSVLGAVIVNINSGNVQEKDLNYEHLLAWLHPHRLPLYFYVTANGDIAEQIEGYRKHYPIPHKKNIFIDEVYPENYDKVLQYVKQDKPIGSEAAVNFGAVTYNPNDDKLIQIIKFAKISIILENKVELNKSLLEPRLEPLLETWRFFPAKKKLAVLYHQFEPHQMDALYREWQYIKTLRFGYFYGGGAYEFPWNQLSYPWENVWY